jgi:DNA repair exonuclease SbcCD ATPase subunit
MKFQSLHLNNWLSHQDSMMPLDTLTCARGENGSGKSSIEQALEMLLTGRSDSTDDKGTGLRDLIRRGADKAYITAEITDTALLGTRTARMRCSVTEKSGRTIAIKDPADASWTGSEFLSMLALKREILDCLTNSRYFIGMDDPRQKKLLAGIILPATVDWDAWVQPAMTECELRVDWSLKAFDLIGMAYQAAYEERKAINRKLKDWREPEAVPVSEMDAQAIRARLKERQDERTKAAVERQKLLDKWQRAQDASGRLQAKLTTLGARLKADETRKEQAQLKLLGKTALKEAERLAAGAEKAKKIDAEIEQNNADLRAARKALATFSDASDAGKCSMCTRPITDEQIIAIGGQLAAPINKMQERDHKLQDDRKALGDFARGQQAVEAHKQAVKDLELIGAHITEVENEIETAQAEIKQSAEVTAPNTAAIDAQIADLNTRIERGNAVLTEAVQTEVKRQAYADTMAAKVKLDAKQGTLERLVEYWGPKGIQTTLLDKHVGGFETSMNQVLANWGFAAHLSFDPYQFGISFTGKEQIYALRCISKSQKAMFSIAFQVALSKVSGFNFVVVDEADVFLDANRGQLYRGLMGAGLDQVIVLQSDLRREIPKAANSIFYLLSLDRSGDVPLTKVERLT